jgi:hypothetical protein
VLAKIPRLHGRHLGFGMTTRPRQPPIPSSFPAQFQCSPQHPCHRSHDTADYALVLSLAQTFPVLQLHSPCSEEPRLKNPARQTPGKERPSYRIQSLSQIKPGWVWRPRYTVQFDGSVHPRSGPRIGETFTYPRHRKQEELLTQLTFTLATDLGPQ